MTDKYEKLQKWADKLLTDHNIDVVKKDKHKMIQQVALYFDALIFNVVSIICLIVVINNGTKITQDTLNAAKKYIESSCEFNYAMTGGSRLGCATFLGANEHMYSASNPTNNVLGVDFANGIARPQIGGSINGGCNSCGGDKNTYKIVHTYINSILTYHDVKATKEIKQEIFHIIRYHLDCLLNIMKKHNKPMTLKTLNKIVKHHKVLQPLK